jgi:peroxiredoxin (alkyl hydroperoxide reductase subunit C)
MEKKMIKIGEKIPEIRARAYQNDEIKSQNFSDYKGKWLVVVFYPEDFTFICPTELEQLADNYEKFQSLNAEVLSVSTDSVFVHKAWHDTSKAIGKITFPMVADPTGQISKLFGTYIEDEGVALRGSFIIDPEGTLVAYEIHDNSIGRNVKELLRKLQAAIYVSEADGEVCPASWEPGENTLVKSLDLVGKL